MIHNATEIIYKLDSKGYFTFVNEKAQDLLGYSKKDLLSLKLTELMVESTSFEATMSIDNNRRGEAQSDYFELELKTKNGELKWAGITINMVSERGGSQGFTGIIRDIHEQKNYETKLRQSEERFRKVFDNSSDLIHVVDESERFVYVNAAWKQKLGYSCLLYTSPSPRDA